MSIRSNRPDLDATKIPSEIDIAWAAGIYEGEGTCRLAGRTKRGFMVSVPQKEPEILYRLRDWFGGSVAKPCGKNPCFNWNVCGDRARVFIAVIYRFLTAHRRAQVDGTNGLEAIEALSLGGISMIEAYEAIGLFNEQKKSRTWRGSERNEIRRENYRKRKAEDPTFLPRLTARNNEWKARQTQNGDTNETPKTA